MSGTETVKTASRQAPAHEHVSAGRSINRLAISATTHCLTGCAIGRYMIGRGKGHEPLDDTPGVYARLAHDIPHRRISEESSMSTFFSSWAAAVGAAGCGRCAAVA